MTSEEKVKTQGVKRSPKWASVRKRYLRAHPNCAVCGGTAKLEVHHIIPFNMAPEKELDEKNLITLCEGHKQINCHLVVGHGFDYKDYNPHARKTAGFFKWLKKCKQKIKVVKQA